MVSLDGQGVGRIRLNEQWQGTLGKRYERGPLISLTYKYNVTHIFVVDVVAVWCLQKSIIKKL